VRQQTSITRLTTCLAAGPETATVFPVRLQEQVSFRKHSLHFGIGVDDLGAARLHIKPKGEELSGHPIMTAQTPLTP